jgi:hypothetical protein
MTTEQKKRARFRTLAKHQGILTASQLAEEHEQPCLPLINDVVTDVAKFNAQAVRAKRAAKRIGFTGVILPDGRVGKITGQDRAAAFQRMRETLQAPEALPEGQDSGATRKTR